MSVTPEQVDAGQSIYTKQTLAFYNLIVLGVSNQFLWQCPTHRLLEHYNKYVSLDSGRGCELREWV